MQVQRSSKINVDKLAVPGYFCEKRKLLQIGRRTRSSRGHQRCAPNAKNAEAARFGYAAVTSQREYRFKYFRINGAGGGNRTHGLGIMRPSLYH